MIYLDNNATTVPLQEAVEAAAAALGPEYGNPSSAHAAGNAARNLLLEARAGVGELIGAAPERILFTGSGTEANNLAVHSLAHAGIWRLITSTVEHSSVLQHVRYLAGRGFDALSVGVADDGRVDLVGLEAALASVDRAAVSVQWVNNETGVIQPVEAVLDLARRYGALIHIDAAQAVGKLPVSVSELDPDFLSFTAHKINGPRGVAALYVRNPRTLHPLRFGGSQEAGLHPGTENLSGIAGFGAAACVRSASLTTTISRMERLRNTFERRILTLCPWTIINGNTAHRVCNTSNIRFPGLDGQALMARLDGEGICCSQSSACTNQKPEPSYVLRAMGLSEAEAYESVRFSVGIFNTEEEVLEAADAVVSVAKQLRRLFA